MGSSRKFLIAGNWKMNKTGAEAIELASDLNALVTKNKNVDIVICPPFTALADLSKLPISKIRLGSQNFHPAANGAFTGEISAEMLKELHVEYVIIGHSERREYFGETDKFVNEKVISAIANGLIPIMCVGETIQQRDANETFDVIKQQITAGLTNIDKISAEKIVIAYEPIWAIGTGKTATPELAQEVHAFIRELLSKIFGPEISKKIKILYGGSMKPENARDLLNKHDIDGGLIGGASLKADSFNAIIAATNIL